MKRIFLFIIVAFSVLLLATTVMAADTPTSPQLISTQQYDYQDVSGYWFADAVAKYGYSDIFANGGQQVFYPNNKITRMEFVRLLHRALDIEINYFAAPDITDYYNDVANEDIGASELNDLVVTGIIDKKTSFAPNEQLNRDEMVHYIINALDYVTGGDYAMIQIMPAPFADDDQITNDFKNDVTKAVVLQLINGRGNNMFYPDQGTTRAEAVTVVDRLVTLASDLKSNVAVNAAATETTTGLQMTLSITNNGDNTVTINHSSGQKYDFDLLDAQGETLYCWSADKLFVMMVTSTQIAPGETVEYTEILENTTYQPLKSQISSVKAYIIGTSTDFTINADGYIAN